MRRLGCRFWILGGRWLRRRVRVLCPFEISYLWGNGLCRGDFRGGLHTMLGGTSWLRAEVRACRFLCLWMAAALFHGLA
jgi:hypothetical protein